LFILNVSLTLKIVIRYSLPVLKMNPLRLRPVRRYFVTLPLSIVIIFLLYNLASKYNVKIESEYPSNAFTINIYHDLNHNGISNKITIDTHAELSENASSILVYDHDQIIDQWPMKGTCCSINQHFIDDFDKDGADEIFILPLLSNKK